MYICMYTGDHLIISLHMHVRMYHQSMKDAATHAIIQRRQALEIHGRCERRAADTYVRT
jgi:hypothetical protein